MGKLNKEILRNEIVKKINNVWVGKKDGEDCFKQLLNAEEVLEKVDSVLNNYSDQEITKNDLKSLILALYRINIQNPPLLESNEANYFSFVPETRTESGDLYELLHFYTYYFEGKYHVRDEYVNLFIIQEA